MKHYVLIVRREVGWLSSPADGGRYDLSTACSHCGAGTIRIDPFFTSASRCKQGVTAGYRLQVIMSKDVFEKLSAAGINCTRPVVDKRSRKPLAFWSLEPEVRLPPWSPESSGFLRSNIQPECPHCRRDGHYDTAGQNLALVYDSLPAVDCLATWEHFGVARLDDPFEKSSIAPPRLIISERVREIFARYRGVEFYPVETKQPIKPPTTPLKS